MGTLARPPLAAISTLTPGRHYDGTGIRHVGPIAFHNRSRRCLITRLLPRQRRRGSARAYGPICVGIVPDVVREIDGS